MITILLGPNNFVKKEYAEQLAEREKAQLGFLVVDGELPVGQLISQDLFSGKKIFVLQDGLQLLNDRTIPQLINSANQILFSEEKMDKRGKFNKDLLANKSVTVKEFYLPHGKELNTWISHRIKFYNGTVHADAVEELAVKLGRDQAKVKRFGGKVVEVTEVYTLEQAANEVQKMLAYANGSAVTKQMVVDLVSENGEADVFDIINAIGENRRGEAFRHIEKFLAGESAGDEKGKIIQLNALLSDQFRNVAIAQDFVQRSIPENEILEKTSWKSGRLFIMKKLAAKFPQKKVFDTLNKLAALDEELKTSQTPPRVLLDLILVQLLG